MVLHQDRQEFANDPRNLQATDGAINEQKGDGDAATWLPPNKAYRCTYVSRQVEVKAVYGLWVTRAEHDAIANLLADCDDTAPQSAAATAPAKCAHKRSRPGRKHTLTCSFSSGAAGNRTRRRNCPDLHKYRIRVRETTRKYAKSPASTPKLLMASTPGQHHPTFQLESGGTADDGVRSPTEVEHLLLPGSSFGPISQLDAIPIAFVASGVVTRGR